MATPVGPVAPDPNDPDLWEEWYQPDDDQFVRGRLTMPVRLLALVVAVGMALLLIFAW